MPVNVFAEDEPVKVYIDGERVYFADNPIIEDGVTLVQFRPIFEKLGLKIDWNKETKTILGSKNGLEIKLVIEQNAALLNGQSKDLEVAPRIINDNTFIPLRFIGESSGKEVKWYGETRTVQIGKQDEKLGKLMLNSKEEVQNYIDKTYNSQSPLKTPVIDVKFNITASENDSRLKPYDYLILFDYEMSYYGQVILDAKNSINPQKQNDGQESAKLIKDYIENMAKDLISRMPNKKILGMTDNSHYRYPNIHVDWLILQSNIWANYDFKPDVPSVFAQYDSPLTNYDETVLSTFRWAPSK